MSSSLSTREATSQTEPVTRYPFVVHSFKDSLSSASFREQVCTVAPSCANSSTIAYLYIYIWEEWMVRNKNQNSCKTYPLTFCNLNHYSSFIQPCLLCRNHQTLQMKWRKVEEEEGSKVTRFLWIHRWPVLSFPANTTYCFCFHCFSHPSFLSVQWRRWYDMMNLLHESECVFGIYNHNLVLSVSIKWRPVNIIGYPSSRLFNYLKVSYRYFL